MLKLMKYELRRNLVSIGVTLAVILGLQGYYLIAVKVRNPEHVAIAAGLLTVASLLTIFAVFVYSVALYSRELSRKSGYLTFMTPYRAATILGAKLFTTLIMGAAFAAILAGFALWDFSIIRGVYTEINFFEFIANEVLSEYDMSVARLLLIGLAFFIEFVVMFFATVSVAYFSITLSATVLSNKWFKGLLSAVLFILIVVGLNSLTGYVVVLRQYQTVTEILLGSWPRFAIDAGVLAVTFASSAWLLERKVSL